MIRIVKSPEPKELRDYRENPSENEEKPSYKQMSSIPSGHVDRSTGASINLHDYVLSKLVEDQGSLCAYCMCKIPEIDRRTGRELKYTIEHIEPQSVTRNTPNWKKEIEYSNFLAVCSGNEGHGQKSLCCDKARGNRELFLSPLDPDCNHLIEYSSSGTIKAAATIPDEDRRNKIDDELNKVLNLNVGKDLKAKRKNVLDGMIASLQKERRDQNIDICRQKLDELESTRNPKPEYVGILIFWLKKHIMSLENRARN